MGLRFGLASMLASAVLLLAFGPKAALAQIGITVTTTVDSLATGDGCSLREAIRNINAQSQLHSDCPTGQFVNRINLPAGTYTLAITNASDADENAAETGDLDVTRFVNLVGTGSGSTFVQAGTSLNTAFDRVLHVTSSGALSMSGVTVRHGKAHNSFGGGGILAEGQTILTDVVVSENASGTSVDFGLGANTIGGGIFSRQQLTLTNVTLTRNTAGDAGGGVRADSTLTITNGVISDNAVSETRGAGGGIAAQSLLQMSGALVTNNRASDAGGIRAQSTARITDSTITNNTATGTGGGIESRDPLTVTRSTISNNTAAGSGGVHAAGLTTTITNSTITGNQATSSAGGLCACSGIATATVSIDGTTISGNSANTIGGGGVSTQFAIGVTITNSTLSGNTTNGNGGGILHRSTVVLAVTNSTLSGNSAVGSGGGLLVLFTGQAPTARLNSVTVANNVADSNNTNAGNGGGLAAISGTLVLKNTLVGDNTDRSGQAPDCSATNDSTVSSQGYNLIESAAGCTIGGDTTGNVIGADPRLGALAANGGATQTHALQIGSPAIDAGNPSGCTDAGGAVLSTDQRGQARQDGDGDGTARCDVGAFELVPISVDLSISKTNGATSVRAGESTSYTIVVTNGSSTDAVPGASVVDTFPAGSSSASWTCTPSAGSSCGAAGGNGNIAMTVTLGPNGTASFGVAAQVAAAARGTLTNTATVTLPAGMTDPTSPNSATDADPIVVRPDLALDKSHTGNFVVGQSGTYTIAVTNAADAGPTVGTITVADTLPNGLTFASASGAGWSCPAPTSQTVTCTNDGPLNPGDTSTLTLTVNVGTAASQGGGVTNTASVSTPDEVNEANNQDSDPTTVVLPPPNLSIQKAHTGLTPANRFVVGTQGTYTLTVRNGAAAGPTTGAITVADTLPNGLTFASASGVGWSCPAPTSQTVTCTNDGPLNPGDTSTLTLTVNITGGAAANVTNEATVATTGDSDLADNTATDTAPVTKPPDLSLAKVHARPFVRGHQGTYTLTVSNAAQAGPTNGPTTVTDTLPSGLTMAGASSGWSCQVSGQSVSCQSQPEFAPGATRELVLTVNVAAETAANVTNTASVATPTEVNTANNDASDPTVVNPPPDLSISKTHTGAFMVGRNGVYTLTVSNAAGAGPTVGPMIVSDSVPNGLGFVSGTGSGWSCAAGPPVTCTNPGPLAPGASSTITLTVSVADAARPSVTNRASVATSEEDATANNTSPGDPTTVNRPPDLAITKARSGNLVVGQNGTYTLTVTNAAEAGPTIGPITVTDALPNGLGFVSASGTGWTCAAGPPVTCTSSGPLAPGVSSTITLTVSVTNAALPSVTNTATVATPDDVGAGNNSGSHTGPVVGSCAPRPPVRVEVVPDGNGVLRATLTAGTSDLVQSNALQTIRFTRIANATVDVQGGPTGAPTGVDIPLTASQQPLVLLVRRGASGPFIAELTVRDACQDWPTFVGGGANVP